MRTSTYLSKTWILAAALLVLAGPALAAEGEFTLSLKSITLGTRYVDVDTDSAKFNEYRDISDGFWLPGLEIEGKTPDLGRWMTLTASNVGQRDARYGLVYDVSGKYAFELDYNKIPHNYINDATFIWQETSPGRFEIADPIQLAIQNTLTTQFAANRNLITFPYLNALIEPYLAAAQRISVGIQRDRTHAKFDLGKSWGVSWMVDYKHENRTGSRPYGAAFGFNNVTELPEPVDYDMDDTVVGGEWKMKRGALRFGYKMSKFENNIDRVIWDNPFRATDSTDSGAYQAPGNSSVAGAAIGLAVPNPDNKSDGFFANGNWRFGKSAWLNFSFNMFSLEQDEPLVAYTTNTTIRTTAGLNASDRAILPQQSADRQVDVTNATADFGTRFGENWTLRLRYRYYDYDNSAHEIDFPGYVRYEGYWQNIPRVAEPFAWEKDTLSAEVGWEIGKASRLGFEYRMDSMDRHHRDIESADDDVLRLTFDSKFGGGWSLRAAAETGDRTTSEYEEDPTMVAGARRFDEAERDYDRYSATVQWAPGEKWSLSFGIDTRKDDYSKSLFGLQEDKYFNYNADFSITPSEKTNLYFFYQRSDRDVSMLSRQSGATPSTNPLDNWGIDFEEANDLFGAGFTIGGEKVKFDFSGRWAKSDGFADFFAFLGGAPLSGRPAGTTGPTDIPTYEDIELLSFLARVDFTLQKNVTLGVFYRYEDYTIDSFILNGLDDYLPGSLILAGNRGDYQADIAGIYLRLSY